MSHNSPLWRANTLAGSPAEELTYVFLWIPLPIVAVAWTYVFQTYIRVSKKKVAAEQSSAPLG